MSLPVTKKHREVSEKGIMEGEADKKQINLFVCQTSIWNIYIYMTLYLLSVFLHKIHAKFVKWKCGQKIDENGRKAVNMKIEIYSFYIRTALLLRKLKHHNERE